MPESQTLLTGDRCGFDLTRANERALMVGQDPSSVPPVLDLETYNDFDLCFVFPKEIKKGEEMMTREEVLNQLAQICRARVGQDLEQLNNELILHYIYKINTKTVREMTRSEFGSLVKTLVFRVLRHLGAVHTQEIGHDKNQHLFLRVRLTEKGACTVADYESYPLQLSREATQYREFRTDPEFVAPYLPFQASIEPAGSTLIWNRYDRLSRPVSLASVAATAGDKHPEASLFRDVDRIRLLNIGLYEFLNVELMIKNKWLVQYFPLRQKSREVALRKSWASLQYVFTTNQPLSDIRDHYGEEIAYYFSWLGYYTKCLALPALCGTIVGTIGLVLNRDLSFDNPLVNASRLSYCIFMALWNVMFFAMWLRREKVLALQWGTSNHGNTCMGKEENPYFKPSAFKPDPVRPEHFIRWFSPVRRSFRKVLSAALLVASCMLLTWAVNEDIMDATAKMMGKTDEDGYFGVESWVATLLPSQSMLEHVGEVALVTSIILKLYNALFKKIVVGVLADFENHNLVSQNARSRCIKLFSLRISGYMAVLCYLAFFKEHFNPCEETSDGRCLPRLSKQLVTFYFVDLAMTLVEILKPVAVYHFKKWRAAPEPSMPAYQYEAYLPVYLKKSGLSGEYLEKIIQFTYTGLFSMACPFLPLLGMLVNLIEIRTDAWKLTTVHKRPWPRDADSLGIWDDIQRSMTFFGVLCNVLLCTFATVGHDLPVANKLVASLLLLLLGLAFKDYIEYKLPAESEKYQLIKARMNVVEYEALWGRESQPQGAN